MPRCIVVDNLTGEVVNRIIAELSDSAPEGCRIELEPEDVASEDQATGGSSDAN